MRVYRFDLRCRRFVAHRFLLVSHEKVPSKFLYFAFYVNGTQKFVNTKTNGAEDAYRQLLAARGTVERGVVVPSESGRLSYEHLRDSYLNGKPEQASNPKIKHLDKFFGGMKATAITTDVLRSYIASRGCKVAGPTVRRELSILRAKFNDALKSKKISHDQTPWFPCPRIPKLPGVTFIPKTSPRFWLTCPRNNRSTRRTPRSSVRLVGATGPSCRDVYESIAICVVLLLPIRHGLPRRCG